MADDAAKKPDVDLSSLAATITAQYPPLGAVLKDASISYTTPPPQLKGMGLEAYPAWGIDNPTPGRPNITVFDRSLQGQALQDAVAADALHFLGAIDPRTGQPVDPTWYQYKQQFLPTMTPGQQRTNQESYEKYKNLGLTENWTFDEYMQKSRADAYLRGGLFPEINPDWQKPGWFTPEQQQLFQQMNQYLRAPAIDPVMQLFLQQRGLDPLLMQAMQRGGVP